DARIPEEYIGSERLRLEAYQKLSAATGPQSADDAIDRVAEELADRYGDLPEPVQHLLAVSRLRRRAQLAGLSEVVVMADRLRIAPLELPDSRQVRLTRLHRGARYLAPQRVVLVPLPEVGRAVLGTAAQRPADADLIAWVGDLFDTLLPAD